MVSLDDASISCRRKGGMVIILGDGGVVFRGGGIPPQLE